MQANDNLTERVNTLADEALIASEEVSLLQDRLARTQRQLNITQGRLREYDAAAYVDVEGGPEVPRVAGSAQEAIDFAREFYSDVLDIPESACRDFDDMDSAAEGMSWANKAWQGLRALGEYARAACGGFAGDFFQWCKTGGSAYGWTANSKKLAMVESETVRNSAKLRSSRMFEVPLEVDSSGRLFMEAHLKVSEGGGDLAPRIYFNYSPTGRRVQIGYYGPHRHVPNTRA